MEVWIISNNYNFHSDQDEQHIVKIFDSKKKAEDYIQILAETNSSQDYDILPWTVE